MIWDKLAFQITQAPEKSWRNPNIPQLRAPKASAAPSKYSGKWQDTGAVAPD
jgi:hypothetical protein